MFYREQHIGDIKKDCFSMRSLYYIHNCITDKKIYFIFARI